MISKKTFYNEILKYPVDKVSDPDFPHEIKYIFTQANTPCCYLYKEGVYTVQLAESIKFTLERHRPRIQYYRSVTYDISSYDLKQFKKHLADLYSQLQTAIKDQKEYNLNLKLKKINHDF